MAEISAAFPFQSHFVEVEGSRMHYVDEGEGDPVLFLHGNPTSSYLWRNVIPHLSGVARCIAPDLIGMGRSDKPAIEYRFFDHVRYVEGFIATLGLSNLTLVGHDWGSALLFHFAARHEDDVKGLAFMEGIVKPFTWDTFPKDARRIFQGFRTPGVGREMIIDKNLFVEAVLPGSIVRKLTEEELHHYREPFQEPASREPTWRWPNEIPIEGEPKHVHDAVVAYTAWLQQTELPKLLFYAHPGALIQADTVEWCRQHLKNLTTVDVGPGSHFLQEDNPNLIGRELARWYRSLGERSSRR